MQISHVILRRKAALIPHEWCATQWRAYAIAESRQLGVELLTKLETLPGWEFKLVTYASIPAWLKQILTDTEPLLMHA